MSVSKYMLELNCLLVPIQFTFSAHAVGTWPQEVSWSIVQYSMSITMPGLRLYPVWFRSLFCWLMDAVWADTLARARNSSPNYVQMGVVPHYII